LHAIALDAPPDAVAAARALLTPDELERADRFVFPEHRRRFALARAGLRRVLAAYLDEDPAALRFVLGPQGKPALAGRAALEFNLSHSHELALCGVKRGRELGVDVEWMRELTDCLGIARTHFAESERRALAATPPAERALVFFRIWTRKEAFIKALGTGLSHPLDRFEVTFGPAGALRTIDGDARAAAEWSMVSLEPAEGYMAAVCAPEPGNAVEWVG
jgi:4'-phosphopantetheinyl transferase